MACNSDIVHNSVHNGGGAHYHGLQQSFLARVYSKGFPAQRVVMIWSVQGTFVLQVGVGDMLELRWRGEIIGSLTCVLTFQLF